MGDVQLRAFTSYTINQVKWKKAFDTFEENQAMKPLVLRREMVILYIFIISTPPLLSLRDVKHKFWQHRNGALICVQNRWSLVKMRLEKTTRKYGCYHRQLSELGNLYGLLNL